MVGQLGYPKGVACPFARGKVHLSHGLCYLNQEFMFLGLPLAVGGKEVSQVFKDINLLASGAPLCVGSLHPLMVGRCRLSGWGFLDHHCLSELVVWVSSALAT